MPELKSDVDDDDTSHTAIVSSMRKIFRPSEAEVLLICMILSLSIFLFDIGAQIGFIISILYLIPAVICVWSPKRRTIFVMAAVASILTILATPLKPPGDIIFAYFNRPVSLIALWTTAVLFDMFTSAQKDSEKALKEERDRLSSLINSISDEVWFANAKGEFTLANPSALSKSNLDSLGDGLSVERFTSTLEVFGSDGRRRAAEDSPPLRALKGEVVKDQEEMIRSPSTGELRYRQVSAAPVRDSNGRIIGSVSVAKDVTERRKSEQALKESEERFRTLADSIPQLCWMANADGWIFWYNRRWYEYTGTTPKQMEGWGWQSVHDPETLPKVLLQWKESIATGHPFDMVFPLKGADGVFRPFLTRVSPVRDEYGMVVRWFGTNTDITEEVESQQDLARSNKELQQFAYIASHDLQEPLRMVINYLSLLDRKYKDQLDPLAREYIGIAVEGGERMRQLINDLLEYSRVETTAKAFAPVKMDDVMSKTLVLLRVPIMESGAEVTFDPLPTILADESQMMQVMQNLIGNAIKFGGRESPKIAISVSRGSREWIFSINDNGIGLNMKYGEKIFEMFQRLHSADHYPGTGVGLAITKKIIEHHGGRIWVESEEGKGATFFFTIPNQA